MSSPAIKKLKYHAQLSRTTATHYHVEVQRHQADVCFNRSSTIDVDNCLRLIELYEAEADSYEAALVLLEKANTAPCQPIGPFNICK